MEHVLFPCFCICKSKAYVQHQHDMCSFLCKMAQPFLVKRKSCIPSLIGFNRSKSDGVVVNAMLTRPVTLHLFKSIYFQLLWLIYTSIWHRIRIIKTMIRFICELPQDMGSLQWTPLASHMNLQCANELPYRKCLFRDVLP